MSYKTKFVARSCPAVSLIEIWSIGGEISKVPDRTSDMLNGLKYYSLEIRLDEICYYIQAFESEAAELYRVAMALCTKSNLSNKNLEFKS